MLLNRPRLSNLGYVAVKEQTADNTPVTPNVFIPAQSASLDTIMNFEDNTAIMGNRAARQDLLPGLRTHSGELELLADPNTAIYWLSMILNRTGVTGAGPYTWAFTADEPANSFTVDIAKAGIVYRIWGVKASSLNITYNDNKAHAVLEIAGLGSFIEREVSSVTGSGPYTITFKTEYDESPTTGLVVGDLITLYDVSADAEISAIVDTIENATQITVSENVSAGASGDIVHLRAQTPSWSLLLPALWSDTEFRFGASAAAALSATHTPMAPGSGLTLTSDFSEDEGEHYSGSPDPAFIVHSVLDAEIALNRYLHREDLNNWLKLADKGLVIRHFGEAVSGTDSEIRFSFNLVNWRDYPVPIETGNQVNVQGIMVPSYNRSDGALLTATIINGKSAM